MLHLLLEIKVVALGFLISELLSFAQSLFSQPVH
jgi:hypothetical protein